MRRPYGKENQVKVMKRPIPHFDKLLKAAARKSLCLASDWLVRTQVRDAWPFWDANKGRYPYHILIDPVKRSKTKRMWSTCWKTARAAQGLYSAFSVTGKKEYLEAANRGLEYVATLQFFEPGYEEFHGGFREDSPQGPHLAVRDGMEAVQAFINGYLVTGEERYLRRAVVGADWTLKLLNSDKYPCYLVFPLQRRYVPVQPDSALFIRCAGAIIFTQLSAITGRKDYITKGAVPLSDYILENCIGANGALVPDRGRSGYHHLDAGAKLKNVISNDDGVGVALLSTYAVTRDEKYLKAALGMADFWADVDEDPTRLAAFSSLSLFLSDVYRLTRDRKYLPAIRRFTRKTIELQYLDRKEPLLHGGYIGEDMAKHYDKTTEPTDWVDLRITSYTLIAFSKIAAERPSEWGCAYSCFGW